MSSVRAIAYKAGVSITTVSRVLNNHPQVSDGVRQRVLDATAETGYVPTIGRKSTTNIALLYTGESSLGSPFDGAILHGMNSGMEEHGYDLMVLDARRSRNAGETLSQMMMRKGVRGALVRTTSSTRDVVNQLAAEGFPFVVVADRFDNPAVSYVYADSAAASREATEHLIALGHTKIGIGLNNVDDSDHQDRLAGFEQAMRGAGLPVHPRNVFRTPANREGGIQLLRRAMGRPDRPTALFLADPMMAVGIMGEARRAGVRVPEDLSIVGFDDGDLRYMLSPELTAVCQDASDLGREGFFALHGLLNDESKRPVRRALSTWLEVHHSTARLGKPPT